MELRPATPSPAVEPLRTAVICAACDNEPDILLARHNEPSECSRKLGPWSRTVAHSARRPDSLWLTCRSAAGQRAKESWTRMFFARPTAHAGVGSPGRREPGGEDFDRAQK